MKRMFILILVGLLLLTLGCSKDVLTEPPGMTITDGTSEITGKRGTYSWSHADGLGWNSVEACGVHPLEMEPDVLTTESETVDLWFTPKPDSLTVTVWHDMEKSEPAEVSGNTLTLLDGNHIYEVTADWAMEKYHGDANYVFSVEKTTDLSLDKIKEPSVLTVSAVDAQVTALRGTCNWEYVSGTTRSSVTREGMTASEIGFDLPTIVTSNQEVMLDFSLEPDSLTVKYWMDEYAWKMESEEIPVSDHVLPLKEGGGYYEVTATWSGDARYGGEVTYAFYRIDPEFLTCPLRMTVHYGDQTFKPGVGAETWGFDNDHDGEWYGFIAELIHPLDTDFRTEPDFETSETYVTLEFPVEPDVIFVCCWSEDCLGNFFAPYEECELEDYKLKLKPGNYIYEVEAHWGQNDCGGTVYYDFYVGNGDILFATAEANGTYSCYRMNGEKELEKLTESAQPMFVSGSRCSYVVMDDSGWYVETYAYTTAETISSSRFAIWNLYPQTDQLQVSGNNAFIPVEFNNTGEYRFLVCGLDGGQQTLDLVDLDIYGDFVAEKDVVYYFDAETGYPMAYDLQDGTLKQISAEKRLFSVPYLYVDSGYLWYMTESKQGYVTGVSLEDGSVITHELPSFASDDSNFWIADGFLFYFMNRHTEDFTQFYGELYKTDLLSGDSSLVAEHVLYDQYHPPKLQIFEDGVIISGSYQADVEPEYFVDYIPLDGSEILALRRTRMPPGETAN